MLRVPGRREGHLLGSAVHLPGRMQVPRRVRAPNNNAAVSLFWHSIQPPRLAALHPWRLTLPTTRWLLGSAAGEDVHHMRAKLLIATLHHCLRVDTAWIQPSRSRSTRGLPLRFAGRALTDEFLTLGCIPTTLHPRLPAHRAHHRRRLPGGSPPAAAAAAAAALSSSAARRPYCRSISLSTLTCAPPPPACSPTSGSGGATSDSALPGAVLAIADAPNPAGSTAQANRMLNTCGLVGVRSGAIAQWGNRMREKSLDTSI